MDCYIVGSLARYYRNCAAGLDYAGRSLAAVNMPHGFSGSYACLSLALVVAAVSAVQTEDYGQQTVEVAVVAVVPVIPGVRYPEVVVVLGVVAAAGRFSP